MAFLIDKFNADDAIPLRIDPVAKFVPVVSEVNPGIDRLGIKVSPEITDTTL